MLIAKIKKTSARDLWEFLDKPYTEFTKWFKQFKDYGFVVNQDYRELRIKIRTSHGAEHEAIDYEVTVDMTKELAMLQKTEKGKMARQYFIELEKKNSIYLGGIYGNKTCISKTSC